MSRPNCISHSVLRPFIHPIPFTSSSFAFSIFMIKFTLSFAIFILGLVVASPAPKKIATSIPIQHMPNARRDAQKLRNTGYSLRPSSSQAPKRAVPANPFDIQDLRRTLAARGAVSGVVPMTDLGETRRLLTAHSYFDVELTFSLKYGAGSCPVGAPRSARLSPCSLNLLFHSRLSSSRFLLSLRHWF